MRITLKAREKRLLVLLGIAVLIAAWKFVPRPWHPTATINTAHFQIRSTATREQTENMGRAAEQLYLAYSNRFSALPGFSATQPSLQMKLYRDRKEMRRINPGLGWAEAFYRHPYCHAYYSVAETNPYQWMLHEATHQLNEEVAHIRLEKWLSEGLAEYFSTSRISRGELKLGTIDANTYPVWWLDLIATTPNLETNIANGTVIPLRAIVTGRGGPSMSRHFNLYYLHWWTLTHLIFTAPQYQGKATALVQQGGGIEAFERLIGPIDQVTLEWHAHVRRIKAAVEGHDIRFWKNGEVPQP